MVTTGHRQTPFCVIISVAAAAIPASGSCWAGVHNPFRLLGRCFFPTREQSGLEEIILGSAKLAARGHQFWAKIWENHATLKTYMWGEAGRVMEMRLFQQAIKGPFPIFFFLLFLVYYVSNDEGTQDLNGGYPDQKKIDRGILEKSVTSFWTLGAIKSIWILLYWSWSQP